jgi:hypothetical protein
LAGFFVKSNKQISLDDGRNLWKGYEATAFWPDKRGNLSPCGKICEKSDKCAVILLAISPDINFISF